METAPATKQPKRQRLHVTSVKHVDQHVFVHRFAAFLKKSGKLKVPEWVDLVKTGKHKELGPTNSDWFYIRCAAFIRRLYIRSPMGVGLTSRIFGGKQRRGVRPSHFARGSRNVARKVIQALEALKLVEPHADGGRTLSCQGRRDIDRIAFQIAKNKAKSISKKGKKSGITVLVPSGSAPPEIVN